MTAVRRRGAPTTSKAASQAPGLLKQAVSSALVAFDKETVRSKKTGQVDHRQSARMNRVAAGRESRRADQSVGGAGLMLLAGPVGLPFVALAMVDTLPERLHAKGNEIQADAHDAIAAAAPEKLWK